MIALSDALQVMFNKDSIGNPIPFDVVFTTHNEKDNDYGRIIRAEKVTVRSRRSTINIKNRTLNLHFENGEIRSCHIPLITHLNNQRIS